MYDQAIAKLAKQKDFDYEIYREEESGITCKFVNGKIHSIDHLSESSTGIRILKEGAIAFSFLTGNDLPVEDIVEKSLKRSNLLHKYPYHSFPSGSSIQVNGLYDRKVADLDENDLLTYGQDLLNRIEINNASIELFEVYTTTVTRTLENSSGTRLSEKSTEFAFLITGFIKEGSYSSESVEKSYVSHNLNRAEMDDQFSKFTDNLKLRKKEGSLINKKYSLVIEPSLFYELIIEPVIENITLESLYYKSSIYNKLNEKIMPSWLTVYDDGTQDNMPNSIEFDREGIRPEKKEIIKNGTLKNYIGNDLFSTLLGIDCRGNASGGSDEQPYSDVTNIFVDPGEFALDNLIADVREGIIAEQFTGYIDSLSGNFSGLLKGAYKIINGEVKSGIKGLNISGNIKDLIKEIKGTSKERPYRIYGKIPYGYIPDFKVG
ncbi:MAG: TldD/PmbA family protein [Candidatus Thermoplasmatota archaeon]|jgi:predicted Zn-dependent protease|nr:TldD/PmbA family protein [Candidatus Thermoplasmatota archaeon]